MLPIAVRAWSLLFGVVFSVASQSHWVRPLPQNDPRARDVADAAKAWRTAVLAKDHHTLVKYGWPEERERLRVRLADERSVLWRTLFGATLSATRFFERQSVVGVTVFEGPGSYEKGHPWAACFFDGSKEPPAWPGSYPDLQLLSDLQATFCLTIQRDAGEWRVSYGFAREDDEEEEDALALRAETVKSARSTPE